MTLDELGQRYRDELCCIVQQGMLQATEMLFRLLRQPVNVQVADVWMSDQGLPAQQADAINLGIYMGVSGDINGGLLLALEEECAGWLSRQLLGVTELENLLVEPACSTLKEVGNILTSAFLASLDDQLGLRALPAPPTLSRAALKDQLGACQPDHGDACLVVQYRLQGSGEAADLQGAIYLFPDNVTLNSLLERIGRPK